MVQYKNCCLPARQIFHTRVEMLGTVFILYSSAPYICVPCIVIFPMYTNVHVPCKKAYIFYSTVCVCVLYAHLLHGCMYIYMYIDLFHQVCLNTLIEIMFLRNASFQILPLTIWLSLLLTYSTYSFTLHTFIKFVGDLCIMKQKKKTVHNNY